MMLGRRLLRYLERALASLRDQEARGREPVATHLSILILPLVVLWMDLVTLLEEAIKISIGKDLQLEWRQELHFLTEASSTETLSSNLTATIKYL